MAARWTLFSLWFLHQSFVGCYGEDSDEAATTAEGDSSSSSDIDISGHLTGVIIVLCTLFFCIAMCCLGAFLSSYLHRNHRRRKSVIELDSVLRQGSVINQRASSVDSNMGLKPPSPSGDHSPADTPNTPGSEENTAGMDTVETPEFTIVMAADTKSEAEAEPQSPPDAHQSAVSHGSTDTVVVYAPSAELEEEEVVGVETVDGAEAVDGTEAVDEEMGSPAAEVAAE